MINQDESHAGAILSIDLDAICGNWRMLKCWVAGNCAAVVKADAYGLGALKVVPALYQAGCRHFFVAHLGEALPLRSVLAPDAALYVLHGPPRGGEEAFEHHGIVPVLNSPPQIAAWCALAAKRDKALPAVLQVDTGMARLGLSDSELEVVSASPDSLLGLDLRFIMSHLVRAEEQDHPLHQVQLKRFHSVLGRFPSARASLANSSGIFLGGAFHFDLARPGAALYGVAPVAGSPNPMRPVVRLQGRVVQMRTVQAQTAIGYGHTWTAQRPSRIATVAVGYADGYLRSLSNRGQVHFEGQGLPLVGNVSMDTITIDASDVPEGKMREGSLIDLIGPQQGVDAVAASAGTIGYEILTGLGSRYARRYVGGL